MTAYNIASFSKMVRAIVMSEIAFESDVLKGPINCVFSFFSR